jgi:hypothetical protein
MTKIAVSGSESGSIIQRHGSATLTTSLLLFQLKTRKEIKT